MFDGDSWTCTLRNKSLEKDYNDPHTANSPWPHLTLSLFRIDHQAWSDQKPGFFRSGPPAGSELGCPRVPKATSLMAFIPLLIWASFVFGVSRLPLPASATLPQCMWDESKIPVGALCRTSFEAGRRLHFERATNNEVLRTLASIALLIGELG